MPILKITLFGKFQVENGQGAVAGFEPSKVQELFSFLMAYRDRPHPRESLAALLWGDVPTARSKKNLRQCLWMLNNTLGALASEGNRPLLLVEDDWVQVNPQADYWLDMAEFENVYTRVHSLVGETMEEEDATCIREAANLYKDGFLAGWYQEWCAFERERLNLMCLGMLNKLMGYCETHQLYDQGIAYGEQALRIDPASERTHVRLMRLYYLANNRSESLRQYERCKHSLKTDLGVAPSQGTRELYEQICLGRVDWQPLNWNGLVPANKTASLPEVLDSLNRFMRALVEAQEQIQRQIRDLERLSKDQP
jgi:DNA-binding SARP family transcriptional activator